MDFNDIQNAWNNEKSENVILPKNLDKIHSANTPLDKIKKNLKVEFYFQILSVFFMGSVPLIIEISSKITFFYYLLYSLFVAVSVYYLMKFYFFYKRLNKINLTTKDSLYETYFDIRLNMELYKTFGFALTPFLILYMLGFYYYSFSNVPDFADHEFSHGQLIVFYLIVFFVMLFMAVSLEWWVHNFYGKFAKEIKKVIDELKDE